MQHAIERSCWRGEIEDLVKTIEINTYKSSEINSNSIFISKSVQAKVEAISNDVKNQESIAKMIYFLPR